MRGCNIKMTKIIKIPILGSIYKVHIDSYSDNTRYHSDNIDGFEDCSTKEIHICDLNTRPKNSCDFLNNDIRTKHVIKHEIIHAFMDESGVFTSSWAHNEELVDWIAWHLDGIYNTSQEIIKKSKKNKRR